jgi:two-component sensor histidine kinase
LENLIASPEVAQAIASEEFQNLLAHISIAIAVSKERHGVQQIIYANEAFAGLVGEPKAQVEGKAWSVLNSFVHEDDPQLRLGHAVLNGEDFLGIYWREGENQRPLLVQAYASAIEKEDGTENYRLAALVDVSTRARDAREEFERQIRDKDLLLKEIQHRVKNNLQLIIAMIRLEARAAREGERVDLERLASRIESLQLLYQSLSAEATNEEIDLGQYLSQIATAALRTHSGDGIELALKVNYAPVSVNVALPVGLVVNELLTNIFKYAFVGRQRGKIALECTRDDGDRYSVTVGDDGVGLPPGVTWPAPGKLGALVMQSLRENAKTDLEVVSAPDLGTRVTVTFTFRATAKAN